MRLEQLTIVRFKGVSYMKLDLRGKSADIYGDNATGKTTIADALTWLLFDKDTDGRKAFSVKPLNAAGEVAEPGVETNVEGVFTQGGKTIELRKTYHEVWARKRGSAQAELTGNTSDYYLNGVPTTARAYAQAIDAMIPAALVPMLSDPTYFARTLEWKKRRAVLLEMAGGVEDADVAVQDEAFAALIQRANGMDVAELLAVLRADRRKTNDELSKIPARIEELTQLKEEEPANLPEVRERLEALRQRLHALKNPQDGAEAEALQAARLAHVQAEKAYLAHRDTEAARVRALRIKAREALTPLYDRQDALRDALMRIQRKADRAAMTQETASARLEELRQRFAQTAARQFDGDTTCPTCGQALPADMLEESRARYDMETEQMLSDINAEGVRLKEQAAQAEADEKDAKVEAVRLKKELLDVETAIKAAAAVDETPDAEYTTKQAELKEAVDRTAEEVEKLAEMANLTRSETAQDIRQTETQIAGLERAAQIPARNAQLEERLKELNERQKELGAMLAECDMLTEAAERFGREKCRMLQERIDALFRGVSWRLWREQINGGMADCCDALIDGVPFEDANNAAKINAGMEIIAVLSAHYGLEMPVIVDNAEAVTSLDASEGLQIIRLIVSENDKRLRFEIRR